MTTETIYMASFFIMLICGFLIYLIFIIDGLYFSYTGEFIEEKLSKKAYKRINQIHATVTILFIVSLVVFIVMSLIQGR